MKDGVSDHLPEDVVVRIPMPQGSLIVMYSDPRYRWEHSVLREDVTSRRVCIAYREFTPNYLPGGVDYVEAKGIFDLAQQFWDHKNDQAVSNNEK